MKVLEVTDAEFPEAQSRPLAMARLGIAHQRSLAHRDIISARQLGAAMSALAEPDDAVHLSLRCAQLSTLSCLFCGKHLLVERSSHRILEMVFWIPMLLPCLHTILDKLKSRINNIARTSSGAFLSTRSLLLLRIQHGLNRCSGKF